MLAKLADQHPDLPNLDAVLYQRAWVLVDLERPEDADELFARVWKDHRESEYWADAAYRLAERAARSNDHERAMRLADQIIQSDCDADILNHALYLKGQSAAALERWQTLSSRCGEILEQFPDSALGVAGGVLDRRSPLPAGRVRASRPTVRRPGRRRRRVVRTNGWG